MKTYTREEAVLAMLDGKQVTSDEFNIPDEEFCIYNKNKKQPFRCMGEHGEVPLTNYWDCKVWRERKYTPKDKELVWSWSPEDKAFSVLNYYDAINNTTFTYFGARNGTEYANYAPFNGTPPPNMCKPEELED